MNRDFFSNELAELTFLLSKAETATEATDAWTHYPSTKGLNGIVALDSYTGTVIPPTVRRLLKNRPDVIFNYFAGEDVYFLSDDIHADYQAGRSAQFKVDYSLAFDTNFASYINSVIRGEPLRGLHHAVISLLDEILHEDMNFDFIFYMTENVKLVPIRFSAQPQPRPPVSKLIFWKTLNEKFRKNMVSLQIFRSIDCLEYRRTSNPKPQFTYRQAARRAVNYAYDFYASNTGHQHIRQFTLLQRTILLQLIGLYRINISSNRASHNKFSEFLDFVHSVTGKYLDREAIVAHKYLTRPNNFAMLEKIKPLKKTKRFLRKLDNIAWDLASPRQMEHMLISKGSGDFFLPLFISLDGGLKDMLRLYPVKGVVFDPNSGEFIPLPKVLSQDYFKEHNCLAALEKMAAGKLERLARPPLDHPTLNKLILQEYRHLRRYLR